MASAVVSDNFETSTGAIPQLGGADVTTRLSSAWVNFNGTGTVAIRASYNISSITDNGTGLYTVNFTTAMPDTNYSYVTSGAEGLASTRSDLGVNASSSNTVLAGSIKISTVYSSSATLFDAPEVNVTVFR